MQMESFFNGGLQRVSSDRRWLLLLGGQPPGVEEVVPVGSIRGIRLTRPAQGAKSGCVPAHQRRILGGSGWAKGGGRYACRWLAAEEAAESGAEGSQAAAQAGAAARRRCCPVRMRRALPGLPRRVLTALAALTPAVEKPRLIRLPALRRNGGAEAERGCALPRCARGRRAFPARPARTSGAGMTRLVSCIIVVGPLVGPLPSSRALALRLLWSGAVVMVTAVRSGAESV